MEKYDIRIENVSNILKLNKIIYNTYIAYNQNYYNCLNINNIFLMYDKDNYIGTKIIRKFFR